MIVRLICEEIDNREVAGFGGKQIVTLRTFDINATNNSSQEFTKWITGESDLFRRRVIGSEVRKCL